MTPKVLSRENIALFICGTAVALVGIYLTYNMYKSCPGEVVRGVWGLVCIIN